MKKKILLFLIMIILSSQTFAWGGASKTGTVSTGSPAHDYFTRLIVKKTMRTYPLVKQDASDKFQDFSLNSKDKEFFKENLIYFHVASGNSDLDSVIPEIQKLNKKLEILEFDQTEGYPWLSPKTALVHLKSIYNKASEFNKGKSMEYAKNYQAANVAFEKIDGYFERLLSNSETIAVYQNSGLHPLAEDYNLKTVSAKDIGQYKSVIFDASSPEIVSQAQQLGVKTLILDPENKNWLAMMKSFLKELNSVK